MTCDIVLAGVGGQGVLSMAAIIAGAAMADGLKVRQSERYPPTCASPTLR
jgi:Pyruvate/2-oxoacid:ferredoxin oxidoreductase gamma subunit